MLLQSFNHKSFVLAAAALTAVCLQTPLTPVQGREAGPFARFAGVWSGDGTITMSDGTRERIRCRIHHSVAEAGTLLQQSLVCASASYKFDVSSEVRARGNQLAGTWTETTRNVTGSVSGQVYDGVIRATVMGPAFSAGFSLAVRGNSQSVVIRPQAGTDVVEVTVRLRRG